MGSREHTVDRVAVLETAEEHGVERAAQRHGVSVRTIKRWRAIEKDRERAREPLAAATSALADGQPSEPEARREWLDAIDETIAELSATTKRLCRMAGPDDLRTVTDALVKLANTRAEFEILRENEAPDGADRTDPPNAADPASSPQR